MRYTVQLFPGSSLAWANPWSLNDNLDTAGDFGEDDVTAYTSAGGAEHLLGQPGWDYSSARRINNHGVVVGGYRIGTVPHAFIWDNGVMTDLNAEMGVAAAWATDINDSGQVVGIASFNGEPYLDHGHAFLWDRDRAPHEYDLGTLDGDLVSGAAAVNSIGQVVGWSAPDVDSLSRAFIYTLGSFQHLQGAVGIATDINDAGEVVGFNGWKSSNPGPEDYGWLLQVGQLTKLPGFFPNAINNHRLIVGDASVHFNIVPAVWDEKHGVQELGPMVFSFGLKVILAMDINDAGVISGGLMSPDFATVAVLMVPKPDFDYPIWVEPREKVGPVYPWKLESPRRDISQQIVSARSRQLAHVIDLLNKTLVEFPAIDEASGSKAE